MNIRSFFSLFFLCGLLLNSCQQEPDNYSIEVKDRYLATVELGETTLLATTLINNLEVPWEITWGSDDNLWMTEQNGQVSRIDPETGDRKIVLRVPDVHYQKSRGLLGMAVHPNLGANPYIYLHYTVLEPDPEMRKVIHSKLVRYTIKEDTLMEPMVVLDNIPGNTYHNGSRVLITPEEKLFLGAGDAGHMSNIQDPSKLEGKILRMNLDGSVPDDNPIPGNMVWSWGHRNPQGLVLVNGRLYESEHGPSTDDEINLIEPGRNYGWPNVHGFCDKENELEFCRDSNVVEPLFAWTPTIAVAGLDYYNDPAIPEWQNSLINVELKGRAMRVLPLTESGDAIEGEKIYFQNHFGRLRDLCVAPNGDVFIATSNRDWHPRLQPFMYDSTMIKPDDDRIIRLRAADQQAMAWVASFDSQVALAENPEPLPMETEHFVSDLEEGELELGASLYLEQCALCHRPDGNGVDGLYPPLVNTPWVVGNKDRLIATVMRGLSEPIEVNGQTYDQEMPGFAILTDEEIAAILTYIRGSWGNTAGPINAAEVGEERRAL